MKMVALQANWLILHILLVTASATAQQMPEELSRLLPASGEVVGWRLSETPQGYRGEELYQMIDGGADIYHEYGFRQVLSAEYQDKAGKIIKLELYEMESPAAAYGIHSFKVGEGGKALAIGRDALLEDYYLNFWKKNMQVTLIGQDAEEETVQGVIALAEAVAARISQTGERPRLADLLLREPLAFSRAKYLRGPIGLMNVYVFDRENIFRVREGLVGIVEGCRAMVFCYANDREGSEALDYAGSKLSAGTKFTKHSRQGNQYAMLDRKQESVMVSQTGRYIVIVIGKDAEMAQVTSKRLIKKLKGAQRAEKTREDSMDRRDFMKKVIGTGIVAGSTVAFGDYAHLFAATGTFSPTYDLVAVRGGEPEVMFDKAIASLGGIQEFVPKGSKVLVKPNIGWDVTPDRAGNTHPKLVARIVEQCLSAGAKEVSVFDHTCDPWAQCYRNSGIERAVKDAGGRIVSGDSEGYYQQVAVPNGQRLTEAKVHELLLDADVFINVPILKHHSSSMLTIGMKNLMGVVWDRGFWHRNDLHQCIADFASYRKPTLTVVDAYNVMKQNGPRGVSAGDVMAMKSLIVSRDLVAADAAAAKLFGVEPGDIPYIQLAAEMNLGRIDLNALSINRIKL